MNDYGGNQQMVFLRAVIQLAMMTKYSVVKLVQNFNDECYKFHRSIG